MTMTVPESSSMTQAGVATGWLTQGNDWTAAALCARTDPDLLFVTGAAQREAARLCDSCPVKLECLSDALDNRVEFGVWGGLTERQRRAILRRNPAVTDWLTVLSAGRDDVSSRAAG